VITELLLLCHGVGSSGKDLHSLGQALSEPRPQAWEGSVHLLDASDLGQGRQWSPVPGRERGQRAGAARCDDAALCRAVQARQRSSVKTYLDLYADPLAVLTAKLNTVPGSRKPVYTC